jgi:hypothetical protein
VGVTLVKCIPQIKEFEEEGLKTAGAVREPPLRASGPASQDGQRV